MQPVHPMQYRETWLAAPTAYSSHSVQAGGHMQIAPQPHHSWIALIQINLPTCGPFG